MGDSNIEKAELGHTTHKTGTYVGNGADNRNIDIGVDLASKDNVWLVFKQDGSGGGVQRIEYGQGDNAMSFFNQPDMTNRIQALTSTGFQIGEGGEVNNNGSTYRYIALWTEK